MCGEILWEKMWRHESAHDTVCVRLIVRKSTLWAFVEQPVDEMGSFRVKGGGEVTRLGKSTGIAN